MATVFYAWELGAALGHVGTFLPLGQKLREEGHTVHWAISQPALVGEFLDRAGFPWIPAPHFVELSRPGPPISYADILLRFGYAHTDTLLGLVGAWREVMRLTGASVVLADHAPTAVLAARTLNLPVMLFSNGFTVPPARCPLPNMRPWINIPHKTLTSLDSDALASINPVLARYGRPDLPQLASLFDVAEQALLTFPELDHYAERGAASYWGSLPSAGNGRPCVWPPGTGTRVFAYLRRECVHHAAMLDALVAWRQPTVVYAPGLPTATRSRFSATHLIYLDQPADIGQMTREADIAVTYSSLATTTAFLLAGKPLLLLPFHLEQYLVSRRIEEMGAGVLINPEQAPGDLVGKLKALVSQTSFGENARAFAAKYAAFDQGSVIANLIRRIDDLLLENPTPPDFPP